MAVGHGKDAIGRREAGNLRSTAAVPGEREIVPGVRPQVTGTTAPDSHALSRLGCRQHRRGLAAGVRGGGDAVGGVMSSTSHVLSVHFSSTSDGPAGSACGDRIGVLLAATSATIKLPARSGLLLPTTLAAISQLPVVT